MQPYEIELLNTLLDKYERSKGYVNDRPQARRILLRLYGTEKREFPPYDIEDHAARCAINTAAQCLARKGLVTLEWLPGQEGHILRQIALRTDALPECYHLVGRAPLADAVQELTLQLQEVCNTLTADWARNYLEDQLAFLQRNRRPPAAFTTDPAER